MCYVVFSTRGAVFNIVFRQVFSIIRFMYEYLVSKTVFINSYNILHVCSAMYLFLSCGQANFVYVL
jgi:hypothetical protein